MERIKPQKNNPLGLEKATIVWVDGYDHMCCVCGNQGPYSDCDEYGEPVEVFNPITGYIPCRCVRCHPCGRVIDSETLKVIGMVRRPRPR